MFQQLYISTSSAWRPMMSEWHAVGRMLLKAMCCIHVEELEMQPCCSPRCTDLTCIVAPAALSEDCCCQWLLMFLLRQLVWFTLDWMAGRVRQCLLSLVAIQLSLYMPVASCSTHQLYLVMYVDDRLQHSANNVFLTCKKYTVHRQWCNWHANQKHRVCC
jgi:hypothetical protein